MSAGAGEDYSTELLNGERYFLFEAIVEYRDIFGDEWLYKTKQRWQFVAIPGEVLAIMNPAVRSGSWEKWGSPEDNSERRQNPN